MTHLPDYTTSGCRFLGRLERHVCTAAAASGAFVCCVAVQRSRRPSTLWLRSSRKGRGSSGAAVGQPLPRLSPSGLGRRAETGLTPSTSASGLSAPSCCVRACVRVRACVSACVALPRQRSTAAPGRSYRYRPIRPIYLHAFGFSVGARPALPIGATGSAARRRAPRRRGDGTATSRRGSPSGYTRGYTRRCTRGTQGPTRGCSRGVGCSRFGDAAARHSVEGEIEKASAAAVDRKCVSALHAAHGSGRFSVCVRGFVCLCVSSASCAALVRRLFACLFGRSFACLFVCVFACCWAARCPELVVGLVRERALCGFSCAGF
jgi:hypothetical protein